MYYREAWIRRESAISYVLNSLEIINCFHNRPGIPKAPIVSVLTSRKGRIPGVIIPCEHCNEGADPEKGHRSYACALLVKRRTSRQWKKDPYKLKVRKVHFHCNDFASTSVLVPAINMHCQVGN
jgi:hypothetical protein